MEYFEFAAKWWADILRRVCINDYDDDFSNTGFMTQKKFSPISGEMIDIFEKRLAIVVREKTETNGLVKLYTAYYPGGFLKDISQEVGIKPSMVLFPKETTMIVQKNKVQVIRSYNRPYEFFFPDKE